MRQKLFLFVLMFFACSPSGLSGTPADPTSSSPSPAPIEDRSAALLDNYRNGDIACDWCLTVNLLPDHHVPGNWYWPDRRADYRFSWPHAIVVDDTASIASVFQKHGYRSGSDSALFQLEPDSGVSARRWAIQLEVRGRLELSALAEALDNHGLRPATIRELLEYGHLHRNIWRHWTLFTLSNPRPSVRSGQLYPCLMSSGNGTYVQYRSPFDCQPVQTSLLQPAASSCRFLVVRNR